MMDVFYFGARLKDSLTEAFSKAGYKIIRTQYSNGVLGASSNCGAVVLHWKSKKGQQVIGEAKAAGLPILVITSKLAAAVQAGEPSADIYLEEPARDEEIVAMLLEMLTAQPMPLAAAASAR